MLLSGAACGHPSSHSTSHRQPGHRDLAQILLPLLALPYLIPLHSDQQWHISVLNISISGNLKEVLYKASAVGALEGLCLLGVDGGGRSLTLKQTHLPPDPPICLVYFKWSQFLTFFYYLLSISLSMEEEEGLLFSTSGFHMGRCKENNTPPIFSFLLQGPMSWKVLAGW